MVVGVLKFFFPLSNSCLGLGDCEWGYWMQGVISYCDGTGTRRKYGSGLEVLARELNKNITLLFYSSIEVAAREWVGEWRMSVN